MKRFLLPLIGLTIAMGSLVGCGTTNTDKKPETDTPVKQEETADEETTITLVETDVDKGTAHTRKIINAFEAENPTIKVKVIDVPIDDYSKKLAIMLAGGEKIDVMRASNIPEYAAMIEKNQLEDLAPYLAESELKEENYKGLLDNIKKDDKLFGMPFRQDFFVLFYNKDIFDAAGVDYPSNDMTWNEYVELATKVTSGSGNEKIYGSHHHTWRLLVQDWALQDGKNDIINDDYSFMAPYYEWALKMQNEDKSVMDYAALKTGNIHYSGPFFNGQIAMMPMGSWVVPMSMEKLESGESSINWGVTTIPHPEGVEAGTTVGASTQIVVNSKSENKDAAWKFVEFMAGKEGAKIFAELGAIPGYMDADIEKIQQDFLEGNEFFPQDSKEVFNVKKVILETPVHGRSGIIDKILLEEHELIMIGANSLEDGLKKMGERVQDALKD